MCWNIGQKATFDIRLTVSECSYQWNRSRLLEGIDFVVSSYILLSRSSSESFLRTIGVQELCWYRPRIEFPPDELMIPEICKNHSTIVGIVLEI